MNKKRKILITITLVLAIATGVASAILATKYNSQLTLISNIEQGGGWVHVEPSSPEWLRSMIGEDRSKGIDNVVEVWFGSEPSGLDLRILSRCHSVKIISITPSAQDSFEDWIRPSFQGLGWLRHLKELEELDLTGAQLDPSDMRNIQRLFNLKYIKLTGSNLTDDGLYYLSNITGLSSLRLDRTNISDEGLVYLESLRNLELLDLSETNVSDEGMLVLSRLNGITSLDLDNTLITDVGLRHLSSLSQLEFLDLSGTRVSIEGIKEFNKKLPNCWIDEMQRWINQKQQHDK